MHGSLDRRRFLQHTAVAGALAATVGPRAARAATSAADKIVLAVMGTNGRGAALAGDFAAQDGAEVAYIADVDHRATAKGVRAVTERGGAEPQAIGDFRRALDDPQVDALVIAAPDHWHAPATILACAAGKHVYVEKPASHNAQEGEWMVEAARRHGRVVQLGTQRRSSPSYAEAVGRLRGGDIGSVLFARAWINSTRPTIGHGSRAAVPNWLDWNLWQGPAPEQPYVDNLVHYHWHWFWHWGTGELGNNGIHLLDVARWGMGVDDPEQVTCAGGKLFFDDDQQTPDTQLATFQYGNRAIHWEHRTWHRRGFEGLPHGVAFYGTGGTLVIGDQRYVIYDMEGRQVEETSVDRRDVAHLGDFLSAIRDGHRPNATIEEGVRSTLMCHLGNIAYRTGRTVRFDAQTRQIVDDAEQRALWGREYRSGWEPQV